MNKYYRTVQGYISSFIFYLKLFGVLCPIVETSIFDTDAPDVLLFLSCFTALTEPTVRAFRETRIDPDTGSLP